MSFPSPNRKQILTDQQVVASLQRDIHFLRHLDTIPESADGKTLLDHTTVLIGSNFRDLGDTGCYLTHWLRRQKGVGVAPPDALDALKAAIDEEAREHTATHPTVAERANGLDPLVSGIIGLV